MNPASHALPPVAAWVRLWDQSGDPDLAAFLRDHPSLTGDDRLTVLRVDQVRRWAAGRPRPLDHYFALAPNLRADREALLDLIYNEYLARRGAGEAPSAGDYAARFPDLAASIGRQFAVDELVGWDDESRPDPDPRGFTGTTFHPPPAGAELPEWVGRYRVLSVLDSGGQGVVYRAVHPNLQHEVVVKACRTDLARDALAAEGRLLAHSTTRTWPASTTSTSRPTAGRSWQWNTSAASTSSSGRRTAPCRRGLRRRSWPRWRVPWIMPTPGAWSTRT